MFPEIHIHNSLTVPTYYLAISLTVCICLFWIYFRAQKQDLSIPKTLDLSLLVMVGGFLGGRLFHVFYESPEYYWNNPSEVINIANGGFVFYGGFIGGLACALLYAYRCRLNIPAYLDLFAPVIALGYGLGRIACLLAGCCFGKECDLPWAIAGRHPTQLYATVYEVTVVILLLVLEKVRSAKVKSGDIFYIWIALHGIGRLLMESFRDDFRGPQYLFSVSTWISLSLVVIGLTSLLWPKPTARS